MTLTHEGAYLLEEASRLLGRVNSFKERIVYIEISAARLIRIGFVRSWIVEERLSLIYSRELCNFDTSVGFFDFKKLPFIVFFVSCAPGMAEYANLVCERGGLVPKPVYSDGVFLDR